MKWSEAKTYRYFDVTGLESRTCRSREMDLQTPPGSNTNHVTSDVPHEKPELLLKQTILARANQPMVVAFFEFPSIPVSL
jgi:hypothetical protein